ncbi:MAG: rRNA maturation RNase YbeY [Proteobacteria bacterium]|nr:rRNA maturation RNase YbeY [Pseudomonadota bacterium]MYJ97049.1 rRNA maturation RNase YbeY [Pseudomonadota bacterium]
MEAKADREIVVQKAVRGASVPSAASIRRWVGRALGEAPPGEVTVRVVDEAESAHLNERYRRGSGATDVLAFAYGDPSGVDADPHGPDADPEDPGGNSDLADEERAFGDLVICAAVVEREAARRGKPLEAHWAHIAVHGALHLLGYDHEEAEQARVMEGRERELLEAMGFGDPWADEY